MTPAVEWPLKISANGRYVDDQNDVPFYFGGFAGWSGSYTVNTVDITEYANDRFSKNCRSVLMNAMDRVLLEAIPNRDGQLPFTVADDIGTPNDTFFEHVNDVCNVFAAAGIAVFLTVAYFGFFRDPDTDGWYEVLAANGTTKCRTFAAYLATKITAPNVVWVIGGDSNSDDPAIANALGLGIRDVDSTRLITVHTRSTFTGADVYGGTTWLDLNPTYIVEPQGSLLDEYEHAYGQSPTRPTYYVEGRYENEGPDGKELRRQMWLQAAWGGCGHFFAVFPVWLFGYDYGTIEPPPDPDWKPYMQSEGSRWMEIHNRFMRTSVPWHRLVPDFARTVITTGLGNAPTKLACALTAEGDFMLSHIPSARTFTVDLSEFAGEVEFFWLDPTSGEFTTAGTFVNSGTNVFATPDDDNHAGDDDWVFFGRVVGANTMAATGKRLFGPALLTNAAATKYTVPAGTLTKIQNVHVSNPGPNVVTFTMSIGADAAAVRVFEVIPVTPGRPFDSFGPFYMAEGETIQAFASSTNVLVMTINGTEQTVN